MLLSLIHSSIFLHGMEFELVLGFRYIANQTDLLHGFRELKIQGLIWGLVSVHYFIINVYDDFWHSINC
jgi:hypothetical protein